MNFQNHFLIAMPSLEDTFFSRSVIYICEHTKDGAMGLMVNQPIPDLSIKRLLSKLGIQPDVSQNVTGKITLSSPVFAGGPLADDRGFVLHSPRKGFASSLQVSPETMVTTSKDVLDTLGTPEQPGDVLVSLGYSSWSTGQLEKELMENAWLVVEADNKILFHTPVEQRWQTAAKKLGFDIYSMANHVGHA